MPLRDSYLDQPFKPQAQNFQLSVQQDTSQIPQNQTNILPPDKTRVFPGILGWLDRTLLRGGGLRPGRDNDKINAYTSMIQSGALPDDQINSLKERNPDAAPIISQAQLANRQRQMVTQIMQKNFSDPNNPNYHGAITDLNRVGQYDLANKLMTEMKQGQTPLMEKKSLLDRQLELGMITPDQYKTGLNAIIGAGEKIGATTPFSKELIAAGLKPGTPEYDKAMKKKVEKDLSPNMTMMMNQPVDKKEVDFLAEMAIKDPSRARQLISYRDPLTQRAVGVRVAELAKEQGLTGSDVVAGQAGFRASSGALNNLTTYVARVNTSIQKADMSLNLVRETSKKGVAGSVPLINRWIQAGRMNATDQSGADVVAFNNALQTFMNEYARVMAGPASNAMLAEGASARAHEMLNTAMTASQLEAALTVMRKDMQYALSSGKNQVTDLQKQLTQPTSKAESSTDNDPLGIRK